MLAVIASSISAWWWVLIAGVTYTVGDLLMLLYLEATTRTYLVVGTFIFYTIGTCAAMMGYFGEDIPVVTLAAVLVNIIALLILSYFFFDRSIGLMEFLGVVLGVVALVLLEAFD